MLLYALLSVKEKRETSGLDLAYETEKSKYGLNMIEAYFFLLLKKSMEASVQGQWVLSSVFLGLHPVL